MNKKSTLLEKLELSVRMSFKKVLFVTLFMMTGTASSAELIDVSFSALPGDKVKILLQFSDDFSDPNSFVTDEPARIVMDFAGVKNGLTKKVQQVNVGVARSLAAVEAGERTRLVVNLLEKVPFEVSKPANNQLLINIDGVAEPQPTELAELTNSISDIDFRRGEQGEGKLIVNLTNPNALMEVKQESGNIVVALPMVELPERLNRRLDVMDFATPVQLIDVTSKAKQTTLTLTTKGKYDYLSYQSENKLVVEVTPLAENQQQGEKDEFGYQGEKLSLNFQNIEVRAVLQLLADFTEMNLVTSDTVTGNLTLRLKNVPWDQALDIILKTKGLAIRQNGNVMLVAPAAEIAAREKLELQAKKQLVELEPLYTEIIEIKFAKADELSTILSGSDDDSSFLSKRGNITIDGRTNSLLIKDTAKNLTEIRQVIEELDRPVRQVLIESRIVIANDSFTHELGVRFGVSGQNSSDSVAVSGSLSDISNDGENLSVSGTPGSGLNVNLPVASPAGSLGLALAKLPLGGILQLELSAMEQEGQGEVVSSPRVITSNQQQASIEQGTEIPYLEASSSGATSVSFKEAVLKLDVTPQITPDDRIVMDLSVHKDEVGEIFNGIPSIDTRSVDTQVLVDNGETVVLGGIYEQTQADSVTRVPFFSTLPFVGGLFKTTTQTDRKRELLVFITPKIVKEGIQY